MTINRADVEKKLRQLTEQKARLEAWLSANDISDIMGGSVQTDKPQKTTTNGSTHPHISIMPKETKVKFEHLIPDVKGKRITIKKMRNLLGDYNDWIDADKLVLTLRKKGCDSSVGALQNTIHRGVEKGVIIKDGKRIKAGAPITTKKYKRPKGDSTFKQIIRRTIENLPHGVWYRPEQIQMFIKDLYGEETNIYTVLMNLRGLAKGESPLLRRHKGLFTRL